MFEWKIQKTWDNYIKDLGLGRICLWVSLFQILIFGLLFLIFDHIFIFSIYPVVISLFFVAFRKTILSLNQKIIFLLKTIFLTYVIIYNYILVGDIDKLVGGLELYDAYFQRIDFIMFGSSVSIFFYKNLAFLGQFQYLYYDFLQFCYMSYFLFPILGGVFYYSQLSARNKHKVGRYSASVIIFYCLNFLIYILIPVTGPQYFDKSLAELILPLSEFGQYLNTLVLTNHPNYIDCFPSGHTGITVLVTIWMFKIKNHYRYIFAFITFGVIQATLALKYHYILDVIVAIPFAYLCYVLGSRIVPTNIEIRQKRKWRI